MTFNRIKQNPFLTPDLGLSWAAYGAFNPSVVKENNKVHLLYRAMSFPDYVQGVHMSVSSVGYAVGSDGINFEKNKQLIKPEHGWEIFGCEDPRVTKLDDKYYIFYTALSSFPFEANGIKIGVAITKDFCTIDAKHPVTTFNSKAMALFPERINGKIAAVLTVHTDIPPAKIALALFDKEEQIWSAQYWNEWYSSLNYHIIPLLRSAYDHLEVGAPPIKTEYGWILIYSYIENYFSSDKTFGIEIVLLDLKNPLNVIGRTRKPLLIPEKDYELEGNVPNVIFPSGGFLENDELYIYYGGADTNSCLAIGNIKNSLKELTHKEKIHFIPSQIDNGFKRYNQNPIISPRPEFNWEAKATFNPAVIYENNRFHILYRAMSWDDTSVWGYATSSDGLHIDDRSPNPVYQPKEIFEKKLRPGNSGCEDPRITKLGDRFYVFYTAYDGYTPRVAYTSILISDFLNQWWNWERPKVVSTPHIPDKNACLLPKKIDNKYVIFHRIGKNIYIDYIDDLSFTADKWLLNKLSLIEPAYARVQKVGISAPPIETQYGWLLFYHWVIADELEYQIGAALLELNNPSHVIAKDVLLLAPEMDYEKIGNIANVVFPCGTVLLNDDIFLYYGAADTVIGVAKIKLNVILKKLT
ncbi:TPA: hypothetical protein OZL95_003284 [Legionella pneumophila]|uniref:Glycosidase n=1 Tax=Legionella pneumophila TaxID=446 RepID=A0AAN5TC50_LEGPN|nr:hypothetical protein [Legionella pneumophila]RYX49028.1 hypothetical protein D7274_12040 [Legionella pneumophila]HAT1864021.1 hypothetical protein [Legionella pneumophila]HAT7747158.1 hypothetical protein [Legionella pneumophila]HAT7759690.1 hypothetical protein [Legionella pneumophila]HAT8809437.1 hypothetical protein [Legionella pneumophila]